MSIEWTRPIALVLLGLPVLLILASQWRARPSTLATGTLDLWRELVSDRDSEGKRAEFRVPLTIWILALSLLCAVFALADPRPYSAAESREYRLIVDSSPSMFLEHEGETRLAYAAILATEWLEEVKKPGDRVVWIRTIDGVLQEREGLALPTEWNSIPPAHQPETTFYEFDQHSTLWLTDCGPGYDPQRAGLIKSGGVSVPGPVFDSFGEIVVWTGTELEEQLDPYGPGSIGWSPEDAERLPSELLEFARVWASTRGFEFSEPTGTRLTLRAPEPETLRNVYLGRDGWTFEGTAQSLDASLVPGNNWLMADGEVYVRSEPGTIWCLSLIHI